MPEPEGKAREVAARVEDPNSPLNALQLFTFYTMEHRADQVGKNAVYTMLRLMLAARAGPAGRCGSRCSVTASAAR